MRSLDRCHTLSDMRRQAKRYLPKSIFEYVDRGTEDEIALRENRLAFERIKLRSRFMVDLSSRDLSTVILGRRCQLPLAISPTGVAGLLSYHGDVAIAR